MVLTNPAGCGKIGVEILDLGKMIELSPKRERKENCHMFNVKTHVLEMRYQVDR
jgi:hypothetical protein